MLKLTGAGGSRIKLACITTQEKEGKKMGRGLLERDRMMRGLHAPYDTTRLGTFCGGIDVGNVQTAAERIMAQEISIG